MSLPFYPLCSLIIFYHRPFLTIVRRAGSFQTGGDHCPGAGACAVGVWVRLSTTTPGAVICYTNDGSNPTVVAVEPGEVGAIVRGKVIKQDGTPFERVSMQL